MDERERKFCSYCGKPLTQRLSNDRRAIVSTCAEYDKMKGDQWVKHDFIFVRSSTEQEQWLFNPYTGEKVI